MMCHYLNSLEEEFYVSTFYCSMDNCKFCESNEVCKLQDGGNKNEVFKGSCVEVCEMWERVESKDSPIYAYATIRKD